MTYIANYLIIMAKKNSTEAKRIAIQKAEEKAKAKAAKALEKENAKKVKEAEKAKAKAAANLASGKGAFSLVIGFNDQEFETKTDDISATILSLKPGHIKTKVVIDVSYKGNKAQFVLFGIKAKRLFINEMASQFFAKRVALSLGVN